MKIAIIGAGAMGLLLANLLEELKMEYTIFNKGKIGNKILASGNGKCNISNSFYEERCYHYNPLAIEILKNREDLFDLFKKLKIYIKVDREGRMYPISESSLSVVNALTRKITHPIIDLCVTKVIKKENFYFINEIYGPFDKIVIACGSPAGYKPPYDFLDFIKDLDVSVRSFQPSLVGFLTNISLKEISGVRVKAEVSLFSGEKRIHLEQGEVIFKDSGVSGICVMNLSSYYNHLSSKENCFIKINLLQEEYDDYITVLPPKLLNYLQKNSIHPNSFCLKIIDTYSLEFSQVASGGIQIEEVNHSLQLKKDKNIYIGGEVLDVDGVCGGYNLMFAFCCALAIYKELKNEISD